VPDALAAVGAGIGPPVPALGLELGGVQPPLAPLPDCMMLTALSAGLPHEEVRPGCWVVRRQWIGDAIRAACEKRGVP